MRKNKLIRQQMENKYRIRLRELCEVLNPPEYRNKDFKIGLTISQAAESISKLPNYVLNEIREKRLRATIINRKVRIARNDFLQWLQID